MRRAWEEEQAGPPAGPALEDEQEAIRARLERQALDERIEAWVRELRARADVRYVPAAHGVAVGPAPGAEADPEEVGEGGGPPRGRPAWPRRSATDRHLDDPQARAARHEQGLDVEPEAVERTRGKAASAARAVKSLKPHCVSCEAGQDSAGRAR